MERREVEEENGVWDGPTLYAGGLDEIVGLVPCPV